MNKFEQADTIVNEDSGYSGNRFSWFCFYLGFTSLKKILSNSCPSIRKFFVLLSLQNSGRVYENQEYYISAL